MNKLKLLLSCFFLVLGIAGFVLTYSLSNKDSFGKISFDTPRHYDANTIAGAGSGVDSSNDGVAVGLGLISGFSFLSSTLLLTSIQNIKETIKS